ncbi:hypothetical protein [Yoonia sediminilitoris]|uniref:hypothetical protein n=1 Tax=Yoonia sediminilitoris TaxID=1286148 RepID=UPI0014551489|nr:hypothetical protein [Yoonia sediminilitoris]
MRKLTTLSNLANAGGVAQRYPNLDGTDRKDALIYSINERASGEVIYVGQTTADRDWERWREHITLDTWAPWYVDYNHYDTLPRDQWAYDRFVLEELKDVTKFETTVAEQYWMEQHHGNLWNDSTPCSAENFAKRSVNPALYDPARIGLTSSWKPSLKAK